ncbi:large T antigen [Alphapolyomavirus cardiodermae]|uniref:Large T antigen n=1 Tax=Alphapolyomavirus cardiodermae TaxID=1891718 RepID=L0GBA8_9POLY|nr:large T antigen [Alphapolyomavirus cardiodermae]AGA82583.1 large T antigen [Alphapolyomavirus cardiodermae]
MDTALSAYDKLQLCELLGIPRHCYGNYPLMKSSYRQACLKHHPDKGGDDNTMTLLNVLWGKFQTGVYEMRRQFPSFEEDDFEEEDLSPPYGTSQFRHWWAKQQHHGTKSAAHARTSGNRRRKPSSPHSGTGGGSEGTSTGYSSASQTSNATADTDRTNIPPSAANDETPGSSSTSSRFTFPNPKSSNTRGYRGGNIFGDSSRGPQPNWDDSLYCDESLSPEPPTPTEDEAFSESFSETPFSETSSQRTGSAFTETASQSTDESFSMPSSPPRRRKRNTSPAPSYSSTPPKPKKNRENAPPDDFPVDFTEYLSHAVYSNKTLSAFAIYTTQEKGKLFYSKLESKFKVEFKSRHKVNNGCILLVITLSKHRVSALKNFLMPFCTVSFLIVKGVIKVMDLYNVLSNDPYELIEENKPLQDFEFRDLPKEQTCNWNAVADFANEYGLDDPLIILAHYLDFAKVPPCEKCNSRSSLKPHKAHGKEHKNAKLFLESKSQKSICTQAAEIVLAKRRLLMLELTREEVLTKKLEERLSRLADLSPEDLRLHMAGVAWYNCMFQNFEMKLFKILKLLTENVPKRRNILFRGPINSGKTSLAAALLDLLEGKALNVNCPADKLPFELGCALDKFMICFEDVKGQVGPNKHLQPGQGFHNLDNLRDHLDGAVPVSLERKHVNKKHQIFPPAIITANEYLIPKTVLARIAYTVPFCCKENLRTSLDRNLDLRRKRILQSGTTLLLCLIWCLNINHFKVTLHSEIKKWKELIEVEVGHGNYCKMIENVEAGDNPLKGITEDDQDSEDDSNQ